MMVRVAHDGAPQRLFLLVGKILPRHLAQVGQIGSKNRLDGQGEREQDAQH